MSMKIGGLASGLDTEAIIKALLDEKKVPISQWSSDIADDESKLSVWDEVNSYVSDLQDITSQLTDYSVWNQLSAASSNTDVFTAKSSGTTGNTGTYSVKVNNLAVAQQGRSNAQSSKTADLMGSDTATYTINGATITIGANSSLNDIATAINAQTAKMTNGVKAQIVGTTLTLTNSDTGKGHDMAISYTGGTKNILQTIGMIDGSGALVHETAAEDLEVDVDGVTVTGKKNTNVTDIMDGVTFNFLSESPSGETEKLTVSHDTGTIKSLIEDFVSAYNDLMDYAGTASSATISDTTGKLTSYGALQGDSDLQTLQSKARSILSSLFTGSGAVFQSLSSMGIGFDSVGNTLSIIDEDALDNALDNNFTDVESLFRGWGTTMSNGVVRGSGIMRQLNDFLYDEIDPTDGIITNKVNNLNSDIDEKTTKISDLTSRLSNYENLMWEHYAAMEDMVSSLKSGYDYLIQNLG
jgi:flagellar hook-associated protein 2